MTLIAIEKAGLAFGTAPLLDQVSFTITKGDKVGLIGRNGSGKSTLLKVLAGAIDLDSGNIHVNKNIRIVYVAQEPQLDLNNTIMLELFASFGRVWEDLTKYNHVTTMLATSNEESREDLTKQLHELQNQIEQNNGFKLKNRIDAMLSELQLDGNLAIVSLSGGLKKKIAIAKALILEPEVLLLDEPTNHLDIATTIWLENIINKFNGSVILISHDRTFINNTVNKIIELDRGQLTVYPGSFSKYQEYKNNQLLVEAKNNDHFDKFLAKEEVWIRKGIEARRTRNEGRVKKLKELRKVRESRREALGKVMITLDDGIKSGKIVADLKNVYLKLGEKTILQDFSTTILRGDKIGLIGANGVGKSSLLKVILGELAADSGRINLGSNLQIAYFDQLREQLDENATVQDVVSQGEDYVEINGKRLHIATYLEEFLFAPARFRSPISSLSGGERNRLLLARIFSRPANVLVLDEPTNDLDIETLEILEEILANYPGTLFLVSHDRSFLDNVVTESLVLRGEGDILAIQGGYTDYLEYIAKYGDNFLKKIDKSTDVSVANQESGGAVKNSYKLGRDKPKNKLSFKEERELKTILDVIANLEEEQAKLIAILADGQIYATDPAKACEYQEYLANLNEEINSKTERWEYLEQIATQKR